MVVQQGGTGGFIDRMRKPITDWYPGADSHSEANLCDIWGDGAGKIWVAGYIKYYDNPVLTNYYGEVWYYSGSGSFTRVLNGNNGWSLENYVNGVGFTRAECISGVDSTHIWVGGEEWYDGPSELSYGCIWFHNGSTWVKQTLPTVPYDGTDWQCGPICGIKAVSATEAYAVGLYRAANDPLTRFVLQFDGVSWSVLATVDTMTEDAGWCTGDLYSGAKIYAF
jgi:hypothetical protein